METLKSNSERSKAAITMIWIVLAIGVVSLASNYLTLSLFWNINSGATIDDHAASSNDTRQLVIYTAYIIAFIISAITFIYWFYRAYSNLRVKMPNQLDYSAKSAVYCWFIPFVNFYLPYVIMKSLYTNTHKYLLYKGDDRYTEKLSTGYLGWWWFLWVAGRLLFKAVNQTKIVSNIADKIVIDMLSDGFGIILAIITIIVIKDYANAEKLLFEMNETEDELPPQYQETPQQPIL